jgi:hypothetical protein
MLAVTAEAAQYVKNRNQPIRLEQSPCIDACCFQLQEAPTAKFGPPAKPEEYVEHNIEGITVFVPRAIDAMTLTLTLSSFLGFKRLCIEGWQLV